MQNWGCGIPICERLQSLVSEPYSDVETEDHRLESDSSANRMDSQWEAGG